MIIKSKLFDENALLFLLINSVSMFSKLLLKIGTVKAVFEI